MRLQGLGADLKRLPERLFLLLRHLGALELAQPDEGQESIRIHLGWGLAISWAIGGITCWMIPRKLFIAASLRPSPI